MRNTGSRSSSPQEGAPKRKDDFFTTVLLVSAFLPLVLIAMATLGTALFTPKSICIVLAILGVFIIYTYFKEGQIKL